MASIQTKLFKNNRSQAGRLPEDIAFPESVKNVEIISVGNKRIISLAGKSWDDCQTRKSICADTGNK